VAIAPRSFLYQLDAATGVAVITLNRPERLNALTFEVYAELRDTFRALDTEPGVRAIVLTGAGRAFCSGGDVEDIIGALFARDSQGLREFTQMTCDVILNIRKCRRPVIAALNGTVAGAGAVIATACDFRVASETAKIAFLFVKVGLAGADMGSAYLLPRIVGLGRAAELLMTGAFVDAAEAHRIGLYNRVVPPDGLEAETANVVRALADGPMAGLAATKDALNREMHMDLETALGHEAAVQAELMLGPDFREGFQAFVEKRPPRFATTPPERHER
jgi:enoyl-CoA hydratase/carnithine racemase